MQGYVHFGKKYTVHCILQSIVKNDYFPSSENGMTESESTQKLFHTIAVRRKPPIEKIGICY